MSNDPYFPFYEDDGDPRRQRRQPSRQEQQGWGQDQQGWGNEPQYGYGQQQPGWGHDQPQYGHDQPQYGHDQPQYGYEQQGWEQQPPPPPGRRHTLEPPSQKRKKKKKKRGRSAFALIMTFVLLGCLGGGIYFGYQRLADKFVTPDYSGEGSGDVEVEIPSGANGFEMAQVLKGADVVKSTKAFIAAFDAEPRSKSIQAGKYKMRKQMSGKSAVAAMLDPKNRLASGTTIPEGMSTFKIYKLLEEKLKIPVDQFKAAAADPVKLGVPPEWFKRKDGKPESKSIEGFLFPDTYDFGKDPTAEHVLKTMVKRFLEVTKSMAFTQRLDSKLSPYQALIIASLAQAEARKSADLGKVARVMYNRMFSSSPHLQCKCFQADVTVNYYFETKGLPTKQSKDMTQAELTDPNNPYNRNVVGFIPTPINNPGKAALEGAMAPPAGTWIFFVATDTQGTTAFSSTAKEFCDHKRLAQKNGAIADAGC